MNVTTRLDRRTRVRCRCGLRLIAIPGTLPVYRLDALYRREGWVNDGYEFICGDCAAEMVEAAA